MEDLAAQVHTLKDELERVYRKVDRMEETVAGLQHFLEESRRVARGNGGNEDGDGEDCRNNNNSDGVQHGKYDGRITELHRHITELEEDNRSLREAREGKVSKGETQVCREEVHEMLTPAVKVQRHQAIQLLSKRIKMLMDLLRSALDQGDASRSEAEEMNTRLEDAKGRIQELEVALQASGRDRLPLEYRTDAMRERLEDVADAVGTGSGAEEEKAGMRIELSWAKNSLTEFEQREEQLEHDFSEVGENEDIIGSRGYNEGSGQANTSLTEESGVSNNSPGESASTENDAAWNCLRSSADTQSENGQRQQHQRPDSTWSMVLGQDSRTESSVAVPNAIEEEEEKEEFRSPGERQAAEGVSDSAGDVIGFTESSADRVHVDRSEASAAAGGEDTSTARSRINRLAKNIVPVSHRAEASADHAESSTENSRIHPVMVETACDPNAETVGSMRVAPSHGSYREEQVKPRQSPLVSLSTADACLATSRSSIPHPESSRANLEHSRSSLESSASLIDRDGRYVATRLSGRASLAETLDSLAVDAALLRESTLFPRVSSQVEGSSKRGNMRGDTDRIEHEHVLADFSLSRNARQRSSDPQRQAPVSEAAAATVVMPIASSQRSRCSHRGRRAPAVSNVPPMASVGRGRTDSRGVGEGSSVRRGRSLSWRPLGKGSFVNPCAPNSVRPTVPQSAQTPIPARVSWAPTKKLNPGRGQTSRETRDSRKGRPKTQGSGAASGAIPPEQRGDKISDGVVPEAANKRPKKGKKKSRVTHRTPWEQGKDVGHKGITCAHNGPCSRSCASSICPCGGERRPSSQLPRRCASSTFR